MVLNGAHATRTLKMIISFNIQACTLLQKVKEFIKILGDRILLLFIKLYLE